MSGNRYTSVPSSAMRKSRLESKPSFLPKPRNAGSVDRLSGNVRNQSNARSSSAEPARATMGGVRLSREASATKIPMSRISRSQQGEPNRFSHQTPMTPLQGSQFRPTLTPQRTPTEERSNRIWQTSLDRALACQTIKDERPLNNPAWQRSTFQQVQESLSARGGSTLMRPLTITRFVELAGALLDTVVRDTKLNNDNYVTKLPNFAKRVLYPGAVSKSWLKSVNTLHAFPHALALLAYLLDLVQRIEEPVTDEWLYLEKDDFAILHRDFLYKSWLRFQEPSPQFEDIDSEYLQSLKGLLGNDEEKISELMETIKKYELCLEDEAELAAKADEAARSERRAAQLASLRSTRATRVSCRATTEAAEADRRERAGKIADTDQKIERAQAENQQLRKEVEAQPMSRAERTKLLDEIDYANRVQNSKQSLAEQISKMVTSKEAELALWQRKTLDSCVQYKQGVIQLAAQYPQLLQLQPDEKELMGSGCLEKVTACVETLRGHVTALTAQLAANERDRNAQRRKRDNAVEDTRAKIAEIKQVRARESEALTAELHRERQDAVAASDIQLSLTTKLQELRSKQQEYATQLEQLQHWEQKEQTWCSMLAELRDYVKSAKEESQRVLIEGRQRRAAAMEDVARQCHEALDSVLSKKPTSD